MNEPLEKSCCPEQNEFMTEDILGIEMKLEITENNFFLQSYYKVPSLFGLIWVWKGVNLS